MVDLLNVKIQLLFCFIQPFFNQVSLSYMGVAATQGYNNGKKKNKSENVRESFPSHFSQSTPGNTDGAFRSIRTEKSQQLSDGSPPDFMQTFLRGWILLPGDAESIVALCN